MYALSEDAMKLKVILGTCTYAASFCRDQSHIQWLDTVVSYRYLPGENSSEVNFIILC